MTTPISRRGRPRNALTDAQRADVARLAKRGMGIRRVALRLDVPERAVRAEIEALGTRSRHTLAWTSAQDDYLREHAGEQGARRLAREVSKLGPSRTEGATRQRLVTLDISGCEPVDGMPRGNYTLPELRTDLTISQVVDVTGIERHLIQSRIDRRELGARQEDGAWRVWPAVLRSWLLGAGRDLLTRVLRRGLDDPRELAALLVGEWGVSEESERRARDLRGGGAQADARSAPGANDRPAGLHVPRSGLQGGREARRPAQRPARRG